MPSHLPEFCPTGAVLTSPSMQRGLSMSAKETVSSWACPRDGVHKASG